MVVAREPSLLAFSFGNNEPEDRHLADETHVEHFAQMVERVRGFAPEVPCLIIGPSDRDLTEERSRHIADLIQEGQRRTALTSGCAFFDTLAWEGGRGGLRRLAALNPPFARPDGLHLTEIGYRAMGARLGRALVRSLSLPVGRPVSRDHRSSP